MARNASHSLTQAKDNCGVWSAIATLEDGSTLAVPVTCRSWDCPSCAKRLKRRLQRRLKYAKPTLFATLTTSPLTAPTPRQAFERANSAFAVLIKRWRRRYPHEPLDYFIVWESTKAGWPHIHALLRGPAVSKHWLSRAWRELSGSYIVDIQKVGSIEHAARYLAKYLAKDPQVPDGFRRWRRSAAFFNSAEEPKAEKLRTIGGWRREPYPVRALLYKVVMGGQFAYLDQDGRLRAENDPQRRQFTLSTPMFQSTIEYVRALYPELLRSEHK